MILADDAVRRTRLSAATPAWTGSPTSVERLMLVVDCPPVQNSEVILPADLA